MSTPLPLASLAPVQVTTLQPFFPDIPVLDLLEMFLAVAMSIAMAVDWFTSITVPFFDRTTYLFGETWLNIAFLSSIVTITLLRSVNPHATVVRTVPPCPVLPCCFRESGAQGAVQGRLATALLLAGNGASQIWGVLGQKQPFFFTLNGPGTARNGQTKGTVGTLHNWLDFLVSTSLLAPSHSTIRPITPPKRPNLAVTKR